MWLDLRRFDTGWGELLCFVAAWTIGLAAMWVEYNDKPQTGAGDKVALSGARTPGRAID